MVSKTLSVITIFLSATSVPAQEETSTDLSRYEIVAEGEQAITLSEIEVLEDTYREFVAAEDCDAAIPAIVEFYEAATLAADLIIRGNEPYYSAGLDDRQDALTRQCILMTELSGAERVHNALLMQRNRAWVAEARCLLEVGDQREAITRLYRALDYISADETSLWHEARRLLWAEVGYPP